MDRVGPKYNRVVRVPRRDYIPQVRVLSRPKYNRVVRVPRREYIPQVRVLSWPKYNRVVRVPRREYIPQVRVLSRRGVQPYPKVRDLGDSC